MNKNISIIPKRYFYLPNEKEFDVQDGIDFLKYYRKYAVVVCVLYVCTIFGLKSVMKNRKKFELKRPLAVWNFSLAAFSCVVAVRVIPETYHVLRHFGYYDSVCTKFEDSVVTYWNFLFVLAKLLELCDTLFVVLRKSPLIFLHWYHHITVLLYCWFISTELPATSRYFVDINACVHTLMYAYYGLMTLGFKKSNTFAMFLTAIQLSQMAAALILNGCAVYFKLVYGACHMSNLAIFYAAVMYISYFILFAKFFRDAYLKKSNRIEEGASKRQPMKTEKVK